MNARIWRHVRSGKHNAQPIGRNKQHKNTMTTNLNKIPQSQIKVMNLALFGHAGAVAHGGPIGLEHNTAVHLATDLHDYAGNPATPEILGKQALLNAQLLTIKTTQAAADAALKSGRQYCQASIGLLRPVLGHRW